MMANNSEKVNSKLFPMYLEIIWIRTGEKQHCWRVCFDISREKGKFINSWVYRIKETECSVYICHQPKGRYTQNCRNWCAYLSKYVWKINTYHMCFQKVFTVSMFKCKRLLLYSYCIMYLHYYVNINI